MCMLLMAFSSLFRIGEAANPGPWGLSSINPCGLGSKAKYVAELPLGIVAVSETHLTDSGRKLFKQELSFDCPGRKFLGGYRAANKVEGTHCVGGKYTGVGFVSPFPMRPVAGVWEQDAWLSSRVQAAHFCIQNRWITGGVCYGHAHRSETKEVRAKTDELVSLVLDKVICHPGPKFICGDWNQEPGLLSVEDQLRSLGWMELQDLAKMKWGLEPVPTCKWKTRKDFLFLCPILQKHVNKVEVNQVLFPDHAALIAHMHDLGEPEQVPSWYKPQSIGWEPETMSKFQQWWQESQSDSITDGCHPCQMTAGADDCRFLGQDGESTEATITKTYAAIWKDYEKAVDMYRSAQGQPGLTSKQQGRAMTNKRSFRKRQVVAIKPSRAGEPSLEGECPTFMLKCWFIQWRRLLNLQRILFKQVEAVSVARTAQAKAVWKAVVKAPGFRGGFGHAWRQREITNTGEPVILTAEVPSLQEIQRMCQTVESVVKLHERQVQRKRIVRAKQKHAQDVNAVFRDVKDEGPVPVETLLETNRVKVIDIPDEGSVVFEGGELNPTLPVFGDAASLQIQEVSEGQVWFTNKHTLELGQEITQTEPIGSLDTMFQKFISEWQRRWDKHINAPDDHWTTVINFLEVALPSKPMDLKPEWMKEVRKKPKKAAGGMDGVTREDLMSLPLEFHQRLVALLNDVEVNGVWPEQLMHGAIHSLQKYPDASEVNGYRPITILPIVYRTWSSLRGRELLQHVGQFLPFSLCGSAKGRSAVTMWYAVQSAIELALMDDADLLGGITDITKAFNCLPRIPLMMASIKLGVATNLVRPWAAMLCTLQRHFVIRGAYSEGVMSHTGFAEGCCLSVGAMLVANVSLHVYMQYAAPSVRLWSYIDNWELVATEVGELEHGLHKLTAFASLLDLDLDPAKGIVWAVNAQNRMQLKQQDMPVETSFRDLGGHIQTTKKLTSKTLQEKCEALKPMWVKLARSAAHRNHKHKVLRVKAWASALHAAPGVHVYESTFKTLRAGAFKGLRMTKKGAAPSLYLALCVHPAHDPECHALLTCVRTLRREMHPDVFGAYVASAACVPDRQRVPGPIGVIMSRLDPLGWTWIQSSEFADERGNIIDLYATPHQLLSQRLCQAFQRMIGARMSSRPGFAGLHRVDPVTVCKSSKSLDNEGAGLIRTLLVGTFITADQTGAGHQIAKENRTCKFCQQADSLYHRHWECEATAELRSRLTQQFWQWFDFQPACVQQRGWAVEPEEVRIFHDALTTIPDNTAATVFQGTVGQQMVFFTDGTGLDPQERASRLVAWAWCCVHFHGDLNFQKGASGGVPGQLQTVVRAEITAVISVCKFCILRGCAGVVYSDNQRVVQGVVDLQHGKLEMTGSGNDHDLWTEVAYLLTFHSHQDRTQLTEVEGWLSIGNDTADILAADAIQVDLSDVAGLQAKASRAHKMNQQNHGVLTQFMADVGKLSVNQPKVQAEDTAQVPQDKPSEHDELHTRIIAQEIQSKIPANLMCDGTILWLNWFTRLEEPKCQLRWVSMLELLIHFQAVTKCPGLVCEKLPGKDQRQWQVAQTDEQKSWSRLVRSFGRFSCSMIRLWNHQWRSVERRPACCRIKHWLSCVPLRVDDGFVRLVDDFFKSRELGVVSSTKSLGLAPLASSD